MQGSFPYRNIHCVGAIEILLGVAFPLFVGVGVALALSDASVAEFWVARLCFIVASLDLAGLTVYWLCTVDWPILRRLIIGALIGGITLASTIGAMIWIASREGPKQQTNINLPIGSLHYSNFIAG